MLANVLLYRFEVLGCLTGNCLAGVSASAAWRSGFVRPLLEGDASLLTYAVAGLLFAIWLWVLRRDLDVGGAQLHAPLPSSPISAKPNQEPLLPSEQDS